MARYWSIVQLWAPSFGHRLADASQMKTASGAKVCGAEREMRWSPSARRFPWTTWMQPMRWGNHRSRSRA